MVIVGIDVLFMFNGGWGGVLFKFFKNRFVVKDIIFVNI